MSDSTKKNHIDVEGHYRVEGGNYRGDATIRDLGDSFAVHWMISGAVHAGVGLRTGDTLAVSVGVPVTAVVAYEIHAGPKLHGRYGSFPAGGPVHEEVLSYTGPLREWQIGDNLLAKWSQDPFWYPATVLDRTDEGHYHVRFADGDTEWLSTSHLVADLLTVGDVVYHTRGLFHMDESGARAGASMTPAEIDVARLQMACKIIGREDDTVRLQYEDGVIIRTELDCIRTLAPREV